MSEFLETNKNKYKKIYSIYQEMIPDNNIDKIKNFKPLQIKYNTKLSYAESRCFVFCASTQNDSLNMWNYYLDNNEYQGYCIGFSVEKLIKSFDVEKTNEFDPIIVYYGSVLYDEKKQNNELELFFNKLEKKMQ